MWEFTCSPFGLRNSPAAFSRALSDILGDLPGVFIYMDDVVVGGKDLEEHGANLNRLFRSASEANLILSSEKCVFQGSSLRFLGHLVSDGTIKPDPQRSAPFLNFPVPSSVKQIERFIGLAVYHAKWVPYFSRIMDPLFSALRMKSLPVSLAACNIISQIKQPSIALFCILWTLANRLHCQLMLLLTPLGLYCLRKVDQLPICLSVYL